MAKINVTKSATRVEQREIKLTAQDIVALLGRNVPKDAEELLVQTYRDDDGGLWDHELEDPVCVVTYEITRPAKTRRGAL